MGLQTKLSWAEKTLEAPDMKSAQRPWHAVPVTEVMAAQGSSLAGLNEPEAKRRLDVAGPNRLPQAKRRGAVRRFLAQFRNLLIYVLLAAAVVTAFLGHWIDAQVILAVVLINAVIGYVQEGKAEKALDAIRDMLAPSASVIRSGSRKTVAAQDVVPGDIVLIEAGDRVPADLRLFDVRGLKIDEAILTGESVPVTKDMHPTAAAVPLGDRASMAFSGTLATYGQGKGVVVATGSQTEIGRISGMLAGVTTLQTPLLRQMAVFAKWLTGGILVLAAFVLAFGFLVRSYGFSEIFMAVVGLSVAAIPEGLPAILTITLAIGVQGMARRNAIVRRLPAIETLGSVSVICSDKTGTLTRNEMTVASIAFDAQILSVTGVGYAPQGRFLLDGREVAAQEDLQLTEICRAALLCSDAHLREAEGGWVIDGDPTEGALLVAACKAGFDPAFQRQSWPRRDAIPFDSQHRFMASLHHDHEGRALILAKGAPERILEMCANQRDSNGEVALDRVYWDACIAEIAGRGQRVLAVATKPADLPQIDLQFGDVETGLTFLGLFGLIDPPRAEAVAAVAECRAAGIQVKMITGDHAGTAAAIARQLGLENPESILTGHDLDALDDAELRQRVRKTSIFARTSPAHKLRLVEALQAGGAVVAMTGDGVNDAPALKRADVGVAMGQKGSEAAKEAAEMVLADDNFATIAEAVRAGRTVYDNLKKAILFILPTNGAEAFVLIVAILLGTTLPITAVQILWVNMVTAVTLALTLAFEPSEPNVMARPPRAADEPILSPFLVWRTGFVSTLFMGAIFGMFTLAQARGASIEEARSIAVNTLVVLEIFYLFSVRYLKGTSITWRGLFGTPAVLIAVAVVIGLQLLFTYAPFMQILFKVDALGVTEGLGIVAVGIVALLILELEKWVYGRFAGPKSAA
ncbi:cation-transporting P-type ATPase [Pelagibius sp. Alg239-R121]|uniref:cation-transporting P-type ATPase n=1 Tax=Pelagibius sp. Alg239-R121 TaxID=2993448 RepID=UPI0024A797D7|nr:cation-transporting P-type ATPase [Pelagibius sp. Alg239-R121]